MADFFRDYGTSFALAIAALNTIISLVVGQFFKGGIRVAGLALVKSPFRCAYWSRRWNIIPIHNIKL